MQNRAKQGLSAGLKKNFSSNIYLQIVAIACIISSGFDCPASFVLFAGVSRPAGGQFPFKI